MTRKNLTDLIICTAGCAAHAYLMIIPWTKKFISGIAALLF